MNSSTPDQDAIALVVVEDSPDDVDLLIARLQAGGMRVAARRVETAVELREALASGRCDIVISDHQLPRFGSLEALRIVRESDPDLPFVIVSGAIGEEVAVELMRSGANDYLMKDRLARLVPSVGAALDGAAARRARRATEAALVESEARFRSITANLPGMVFQLHAEGDLLVYDHVSDGARSVLGIEPDALVARPLALFEVLEPDDARALREAAANFGDLHWTGRLQVPAGKPAVWLQLDAGARRLPLGYVQWNGIVRDVSRRVRAQEELHASQEELRALASHLVRVREEEREHLAREIHDDVGSTLTGVKFGLAWLRGQLEDSPALAARVSQTDQIVDAVIHATSRIVHDLRPGIIDEGIVPALEWLTRSHEQRLGIPCRFFASHEDIDLDRDRAIAVFRVCQEALNNAAKYSCATRLDVRLEEAGGSLALEIRDNGRGIGREDMAKSAAWGLRGMRERAVSLGGVLDVSGGPGHGTTIALLLPLAPPRAPVPEENSAS
jgi:signal transduction histidine kinase